jgi:linoleate 10R-lipoxygenase
MLRRFSSTFKKKGDRESKQNGTAPSSSAAVANANSNANNNDNKRHSKISAAHKSSSDDDRNEKKGDSVSPFEKYASVLHASRSPIPNQTGDGAYLENEHTTSLLQDARHLGFKDFKTLKDVIESKLPGGQLIDDKTMLMERIIQVRWPAYDTGRLDQNAETIFLDS